MPAHFSRSVTTVDEVQVAALCGGLDLKTTNGLADQLDRRVEPVGVADRRAIVSATVDHVSARQRRQLVLDMRVTER